MVCCRSAFWILLTDDLGYSSQLETMLHGSRVRGNIKALSAQERGRHLGLVKSVEPGPEARRICLIASG